MQVRRGNLFVDVEPPARGERFVSLAEFSGETHRTIVEHIVSSDMPDPVEYDQKQAEWVVLLAGQAMLEVQGERLSLVAGDYLLLPPHTRHRVLSTSHGARWLAVHVQQAGAEAAASEELDVAGPE